MTLLKFDKPIKVASIFSIVMHLMIILCVSFIPFIPKIIPHKPKMEITVVNKSSPQSGQGESVQKLTENKIITASSAEALISQITKQQLESATQLHRRQISAAIHEQRDENYLDYWRRHIETVGNENYPIAAKRQKISGELRLLVAINKDGSVHSVAIRQSSGNKILDDAALQTIKIAAPFKPLPKEITKDTDVLEIIRTWHYGSDSKLSALS